jgi:hypothetical protein
MMSHGILNAMLPALLAALLVQLPFPGSPVLLAPAGVPLSARALTAAAVLAAAGWTALQRNIRFDALDWALLAYAAAWLVAGLAAPWDFPAALRAGLKLVGGALLCLCLRSAWPAREPRRIRLWLAGAAVVAGILAVLLPGSPASPVPRSDLAAAARLASSQRPLLGWGPGQFREFTARWLATGPSDIRLDPPDLYRHHLADGGLVAAAGLLFLVFAAFIVLVPHAHGRRPDPTARVGLAALVLWLGWGLVASPLPAAGPMLALWIALGLGSATPGVSR